MMVSIQPNWPAPTWVRAITTTRLQGNLALPKAGSSVVVIQNRLKLMQDYHYLYEPNWLHQTHSTQVIEIKTPTLSANANLEADGIYTQLTCKPCAILTADCLPVLFCDTAGTLVAAVHCGWRGLANGIIENTLNAIRLRVNGDILAWLGPAIGPQRFEVGDEVRQLFLKHAYQSCYAFKETKKQGKWMADIYQLAKDRLLEKGVTAIYGGDFCTYTDSTRFYSYRRDKTADRMATLIWLALPVA